MKNTNRFTLGGGGRAGGGRSGAPCEPEQSLPAESTAAETKNTWTTAPIIDVGMRWEPRLTCQCVPTRGLPVTPYDSVRIFPLTKRLWISLLELFISYYKISKSNNCMRKTGLSRKFWLRYLFKKQSLNIYKYK